MVLLFPQIVLYLSLIVLNKSVCCKKATPNGTNVLIYEGPTFYKKNADLPVDKNVIAKSVENDINHNKVHHNSTYNNSSIDAKPKRKIRNVVTTGKPKGQKNTTKSTPRSSSKAIKTFSKTTKTYQSSTTAGPKTDKRLGENTTSKPNVSDESITIEQFHRKYPVHLWKDHGFYTDDFFELINKNWLKHEPTSAFKHYIMGIMYTIIMVVGCFGNALVIIMYIRCKSLQTPANILIMNLAVCDFFMLAKSPVVIYNSFYQGPALGKYGCKIYGFLAGVTGIGSIMTLAAISLDRYYVIVHPLNTAVKTTKPRARILIGLIWTYGIVFSIIPTLDLGLNHFVPEGYLSSCGFDYLSEDINEKRFLLIFFTAAWVVPFGLISVCYIQILAAVWRTNELAASRYGQEVEKRKTEIRLGYVVVGVIMLWFLSWTPYAFMALLGVFDQKDYITPDTSMIPALFCKTAACVDPWVYAITHPKFKKELIKLFSKKKNRKLERDYGMKKGAENSCSARGFRNQSSTEEDEVEEVIVMVNPDHKMHRQGSTSSHKTEETKALEMKFPPTRQESVKYMPPSWYKLPRSKSKSSLKVDLNSVDK
ncbi:opsin, ultraviolet-sensitive-like [Adelges cooleyi]|uniref:opsin, ultraviolet-sensitive-like n=1 Tax=Adelges cooleyi TaxID=133065 RepID=UPI00217FCEC4|nr:opsin, ultraviolet-sensitive-like [Adelges cooleyi]